MSRGTTAAGKSASEEAPCTVSPSDRSGHDGLTCDPTTKEGPRVTDRVRSVAACHSFPFAMSACERVDLFHRAGLHLPIAEPLRG